mmetsp:Transcript_44793/g.43391  ORF Transcript_44793/g.43391 Transcript_44793/m.43391 type:complete len:98 (+) Transcript_44793:1064-1357(+)
MAQGMFSSMFQAKNASTDNAYEEKPASKLVMPGPDKYQLPSTFSEEKLPTALNIFKSDSVRDFTMAQIKRGPGPAFYKPQNVQAMRIYNFNPKEKWI